MITKTPWWIHARIYELYIDRFAGNLNGLTERLPYFLKLGINCLHLLPHFPSPMIDDGYDITDYRNVRTELGTLEDFRNLILQAHAKNIRIIIDFVLNHTSNEHPWFMQARSSHINSKRDFYLWNTAQNGFNGSTNAFPDIKESNWIHNPQTNDYYFATFYPEQPDLNWNNPEVQKEMLSNMDFWADVGVDGFRLDAAPYLIKRENTTSKGLPETHAIIKKIRRHLEEKYPDIILLAEAHESVARTKEYFGNGDECHMAYHFPLMEALWLSLARNDRNIAKRMIAESFDIPQNCQWAVFLRNHDEISLSTLPPADRLELVDFLDQHHEYLFKKANATAVRLASIFDGNQEKIIKAITLLYAMPGAPIMYYGDEIGMRNLPRTKGIIDTRKYVRGTFDWQEAKRQMSNQNSLFNRIAAIVNKAKSTDTSDALE